MNLSNLKPAKGATKKKKRIARGQGSGHGGTSTRGHKGAKSRSGYKRKRNHEGGQMPLAKRLPKFGFNNLNRKEFVALNLSKIEHIVEKHNITDITPEKLRELHLLQKSKSVKVLATGELKTKVNVTAHAFSAAAKEAIEKAGGTATIAE